VTSEIKAGKIELPGKWQCPRCTSPLDGFVSMTDPGAVPKPGSLSICAYCRLGLVFEKRSLRGMTIEEFEALDDETRIDLLRAGVELNRAIEPIYDPLTGRARN
jgi:hypothetical protein